MLTQATSLLYSEPQDFVLELHFKERLWTDSKINLNSHSKFWYKCRILNFIELHLIGSKTKHEAGHMQRNISIMLRSFYSFPTKVKVKITLLQAMEAHRVARG
jgi:hypothetical protein